MDVLKRTSTAERLILGGSILYLIFSFLDWQQVCISSDVLKLSACGGISEWHGVGVIAGLLVIALLVWELVRLFQPDLRLGSVSTALVSAGLALALLLFTLITFLTHNEARHWPSWIGFLLSIAIAGVAVSRARAEA